MMYYLTGANSTLNKGGSPQNDASKSLGGYISTTPVPNGELNIIFDLLSVFTLEKKRKETIGIALINKFDKPVTNVTLKVVTKSDNVASFKVAAVPIGDDMAMEHIPNRYALPIMADFYSANFERAYVDLKITRPANAGEQIVLQPIGRVIDVEDGGMEGTFDAFVAAFVDDEHREVIRVSDNVFRIARTDEKIIENVAYSYYTDGVFSGEFLGVMKNRKTGEVTLINENEMLLPGKAIGIWIQRDITNYKPLNDKQLLENYKNKVHLNEEEDIELVTNYNIVEQKNYNQEYSQENYS